MKIIHLNTKRKEIPPIDDSANRIEATKELAKGIAWMPFFPFALMGSLLGFKGFLIGLGIGTTFYVALLWTMRYGKEP